MRQLIRDYDPALTILELGRLLLKAPGWLIIGSAQEVANTLADISLSGATDGFNLMFPLLTGILIASRNRLSLFSKPKG
ncbi:hypothetical protein [Kluyvera intermedia]|uniref:hypothetical protein n=1 Tax=Kluyvera intermedia TaxID=61648 RepID=UPI00372D4FDE